MKSFFRYSLLIGSILCFSNLLKAQEANLTEAFKKETIQTLSQLMNDHYVFPKVAKQTEEHLNKEWEAGHFKQFESLETFAKALTESVQSINKDKHMRIRPNPVYEAPVNTPERMIEERLNQLKRTREYNDGFNSAKKMEGNVGYLDLRGFSHPGTGAPMADHYMKLLATSDAVIIDLRKNGGGSPDMVQYLCSYFFDQKVHLNSLYYRRGDVTREYWTLDKVNGEKMPDVPLFVLTSDRTFSGAEEFSYNMQTQKRATLIGQTSGGGANPGGTMMINDKLGVFIPTGRAINPITKTNWEGVGVIPEVPTEVGEALDTAHKLAKVAAESYRSKKNKEFKGMLLELNTKLESYSSTSSGQPVIDQLKACQGAGVIEEWDINALGYEYLMEHKKPKTAELIFKANTLLHPNSANVHDSYGEALAMNGDFKTAVLNYEKAVALAQKNDDQDLQLFQENLAKVKAQMKAKE